MNVELVPELAKQLEEKVRAGHFDSIEAAVNGLLFLAIGEFDQPSDEELEHLKPLIAEGMADVAAGNVAEWDDEEIWAEVERRYAEERAKKVG